MFMNDQLTEQILDENTTKPENQKFVKQFATPAYEYLGDIESPRVIKTHLPFSMLPPSVMKKAKVNWLSVGLVFIAVYLRLVHPVYL